MPSLRCYRCRAITSGTCSEECPNTLCNVCHTSDGCCGQCPDDTECGICHPTDDDDGDDDDGDDAGDHECDDEAEACLVCGLCARCDCECED